MAINIENRRKINLCIESIHSMCKSFGFDKMNHKSKDIPNDINVNSNDDKSHQESYSTLCSKAIKNKLDNYKPSVSSTCSKLIDIQAFCEDPEKSSFSKEEYDYIFAVITLKKMDYMDMIAITSFAFKCNTIVSAYLERPEDNKNIKAISFGNYVKDGLAQYINSHDKIKKAFDNFQSFIQNKFEITFIGRDLDREFKDVILSAKNLNLLRELRTKIDSLLEINFPRSSCSDSKFEFHSVIDIKDDKSFDLGCKIYDYFTTYGLFEKLLNEVNKVESEEQELLIIKDIKITNTTIYTQQQEQEQEQANKDQENDAKPPVASDGAQPPVVVQNTESLTDVGTSENPYTAAYSYKTGLTNTYKNYVPKPSAAVVATKAANNAEVQKNDEEKKTQQQQEQANKDQKNDARSKQQKDQSYESSNKHDKSNGSSDNDYYTIKYFSVVGLISVAMCVHYSMCHLYIDFDLPDVSYKELTTCITLAVTEAIGLTYLSTKSSELDNNSTIYDSEHHYDF